MVTLENCGTDFSTNLRDAMGVGRRITYMTKVRWLKGKKVGHFIVTKKLRKIHVLKNRCAKIRILQLL